MKGVVLFAHGARDPDWAAPFAQLLKDVRERLTQSVELAFLEHQSPPLDAAAARLIAQGVTDVRIVPLFLGTGGHLRQDLPQRLDALRARFPEVRFSVEPSLGERPAVLEAIAQEI